MVEMDATLLVSSRVLTCERRQSSDCMWFCASEPPTMASDLPWTNWRNWSVGRVGREAEAAGRRQAVSAGKQRRGRRQGRR
ncbi:hypothetical protein PR202_gb25340 [Eleusine coracana subsp. coracana]|uniref:Uncharacterized protein n=1 Tax=Eleusine coracana subsp. coracana TaxID=191504 RepID=A0AAV5FLC8_ELECO|nr:hypothetical protein PR202_gb25340 [Eleusine coracana subsp. coracana]